MTIPLFGWKDHGPPDIDAANLEAMNAAAGAYTDALAAEKGAASGLASLDGEEHLTASQVPPSVVSSSAAIDICRTYGATPGNDCTEAMQRAISAVVALGGGTVYFSKPGVYQIDGVQVAGTSHGHAYSGQIVFPAVTFAETPVSITIEGPCPPPMVKWGPQSGDN